MSNVMGTSCGPEGALPFGREPGSTWCDDSVLHVMGIGPLVGLGLLLATRSMLAAVAMLRPVSWFVVVAYAILAFIGIANWANFWGNSCLPFPWPRSQSSSRARSRSVGRRYRTVKHIQACRPRRRATKRPVATPIHFVTNDEMYCVPIGYADNKVMSVKGWKWLVDRRFRTSMMCIVSLWIYGREPTVEGSMLAIDGEPN